MNYDDFIPVIKIVLSDKRVIIIAIIVFVYLDFVCYVAHYRKMPKKIRIKKVPAPAAPAASGEAASAEGSESAGESDADSGAPQKKSASSSSASKKK